MHIPWNATIPMNVFERKLPDESNRYDSLNIMNQDNSKLHYDLTVRMLSMQGISTSIGRSPHYKERFLKNFSQNSLKSYSHNFLKIPSKVTHKIFLKFPQKFLKISSKHVSKFSQKILKTFFQNFLKKF